ncbi:LysR family transcriptional regulator [Alishewanella longhuensis]|uniref:LysR family transcriptional regulator n=1 Tax=Alishewanella longhuensis TaxID=1091037 RepID=A0ABQ3L360_9ALTE|nr:LysR substrate-binding domain-containing protein [Alishewanella longhuensis]GHG68301.1 LysR family transcriptional regulator [Alishewanella longhuensis]
MDTELLKTFLEVQRTRHFGKAAENLYLTQSAVSFRIRQLEQQLGVNLFVRYRNNIQLTAAGERLLPHAQTVLSALQRARHDVALSAQQPRQLAMAAPTTIWDALLLNTFIDVQQQKPELSWRTDHLTRETLTRQLLEHQLDLAILFDPPKTDEISIEKLCEVQLIAVTSCTDERLTDLTSQPYCYVDWGSTFETLHGRFFIEKAPVKLRCSSAHLALSWLLQAPGSAYLPEMMVKKHLAQGSLRQLSAMPTIALELYAAYLTDNQYNQELQAVVGLLQQQFTTAQLSNA